VVILVPWLSINQPEGAWCDTTSEGLRQSIGRYIKKLSNRQGLGSLKIPTLTMPWLDLVQPQRHVILVTSKRGSSYSFLIPGCCAIFNVSSHHEYQIPRAIFESFGDDIILVHMGLLQWKLYGLCVASIWSRDILRCAIQPALVGPSSRRSHYLTTTHHSITQSTLTRHSAVDTKLRPNLVSEDLPQFGFVKIWRMFPKAYSDGRTWTVAVRRPTKPWKLAFAESLRARRSRFWTIWRRSNHPTMVDTAWEELAIPLRFQSPVAVINALCMSPWGWVC